MFYPIIVTYNKACSDSPTCQSVLKAGLRAIVCDNSTRDFKNKAFCEEQGFEYISMNGNKGLSKAYNAALDLLKDKEGFAVILDDDTHLPDDFFDKIRKGIDKNPDVVLFLPVVYSGERIISPCLKEGVRIYSPDSIETVKGNTFSAINSGMAINLDYFKNYRYDEGLFLDYIDHDFMDSFRITNQKSVILEDNLLKQEFFGEVNKNKAAAKVRYNLFKKDFVYYTKKHKLQGLTSRLILLKRFLKTL